MRNRSDGFSLLGRLAWWAAAVIGSGCLAVPGAARAGDAPWPRVPPGFVVEQAAADGAVRFPMFAAFDDRGRLFVAESSGLDLYAEIAAGTRKCRVSVLEDRDGDGRFESSRVFADGLVFPMGLAWRDGRLYVADPPDLVALEDTRRRRPRRPPHRDPYRLRPHRQRQPSRPDLRPRRPPLHDDGHAGRLPARDGRRFARWRARAAP